MRIVVNTIPLLSPLTGIGKYTWQICKEFQSVNSDNYDYTFYYGYFSSDLRLGSQSDQASYLSRLKDSIKSFPIIGRYARNIKSIGAVFQKNKYDLYFEPNYVPLKIKAKNVVMTVADLSPFVHPEWHDKELVRYFNQNFWKNLEHADHIVTISDFIRNEAIDKFNFPSQKMTTIHLGYDPAVYKVLPLSSCLSTKLRLNLPERFILCVGSIEPRKNLVRLMKAYQRLPGYIRNDYKLVLAGFRGWNNDEIMSLVHTLEGDVFYTGYVSEEDLAVLYNLASLFIYPSLYEGFGLPLLEAMACGCPIVTSNVSSMPEVCEDAALYFNPTDIDDIAGVIERVLDEQALSENLRAKSQSRVQCFSWDKSARKHIDVFDDLLNN